MNITSRLTLINSVDQDNFALRLLLWIVYNLFFVCLAMFLTIFVGPAAEGSGIAALKAILNGAGLKEPLKLKTFFVKCIGLPCILGAGMFVGKVGPTTHIGLYF